jgi:hypothetical protein
VVLILQGSRHVALRPPDSGTSKKIARELRSRLLGSPGIARIHAHGYTFLVLANRFGPLAAANGLDAQFAAPSGVAGPVDTSGLTRTVEEVGSHRFTSVDLDDLDATIACRSSVCLATIRS